MKKLIILLTFLFCQISYAKTIRVAVIDTGIKQYYIKDANLCPEGHKSFTNTPYFHDRNGHGTNIAGLIKKHSKGVKYCLIIIKSFSTVNNDQNIDRMIRAIDYAYSLKPDIINISAGGDGEFIKEKEIIQKMLNSGIKIVAAAGNESQNLDKDCNYFPACYDKRIWVVGGNELGVGNKSVNGIVDVYIPATNIKAFDITLTGTSQATAIFTGKMLKIMGK